MLVIILVMIFLIIYCVAVNIKMFLYKKQILYITNQIKCFKEKKTIRRINTEINDKYIEDLAFEINECLELYVKNAQEKVEFESTLKQGIANMSHDLRTPLTSIIGYLKLLENNEIDKEGALKILKNKANKLNVLINDFFELASIESEDYELEITKVNLSNILSDEILSFYKAFEEINIEPFINISNKPIFINGDKESLERIVDNLLSNALKYADNNIKISLEESNNKVVLIISNRCTDLDKNDVLHMFDRFYMADKVRTGESAGLGLSIVKSLMRKMNGTIRCKYEEQIVIIICEWERNY
ncbi:sensor histidine kinase [Clostridium botulinum]|uniref:sensor histidine kinase n=1 Tax=Clostridium botulinum TaxID=1491 RepID=UPI000B0BB52B|nr:HAMP domain-containing sensor histidine kinase [Clostridium botulinum]